MPSFGTLVSTLSSGPESLKVKLQAFPHDGSTGLKGPTSSSPPVTDNHHGVGAKGATGCGRWVWEFLGWHRDCVNSVLTSYSRAFSSQTYNILGATGKTITKRFTQALLCCWGGQIFSHKFLVIPECPIPLLGRDLSLPSKSCSYCSPDRRCFKTLFWGQINYFYQPPSEKTPECEMPFMNVWSKDPQISSSADGKSRCDYIPLWLS